MTQYQSDKVELSRTRVSAAPSRPAGARLTLGFYLLSRHALSEWCNE